MREGDTLSIDGSTGEVFLGEVRWCASPVVRYFEGTMSRSTTEAATWCARSTG